MEEPEVQLKVLQGEDQGKGWDLHPRQGYRFGRSRKCNLRLADPSVSGVHARLQCREGVWRIADLESTHGTVVNDQRILQPKPLFDRDLIRLGQTVVEFREYEELAEEDLAEIDRGVELPG